MMDTALRNKIPESAADVCEVELVTSQAARRGEPPELLLEVPHGATRRRHFAATRRRLVGEYPEELEQFFFVNADVGSIECARWVARMATAPTEYPDLAHLAPAVPDEDGAIGSVLIVRGLVARTFIDCNRVISGGPSGALRDGLTPGLPAYVSRPEDIRTLRQMHADYQASAAAAYQAVCGAGGAALILHTYAPRSIHLDRVDAGVVAALRRAYEPDVYESWPRRPDVELITESVEGARLAPEPLVRAVREQYARSGIAAAENATYRLHESTLGYLHSARYPGRVLCLEINRERLVDPFTPFVEMSVSEARARQMAAPIAAALLAARKSG